MTAALKGFTQQLVSANGVKINAVTGGEGPPIVLLHGFPQTWWEWRRVMPLLSEQFSVVAVDLRGAGFSDCAIERCCHYVADERPHEVAAALVQFLSASWATARLRAN